MIANNEVLDALKSIGLNLYERKILVALLAKGIATAAQVSEIAGVPRSRSYDILESLAEKGFVIVQPSKPIKYVALKPSEALERTKESMKKKHDEMLERVDRLKGSPMLENLENVYSEGLDLMNPTEMAGTLKGRDIINRQLRSALRNAQKKVDILTTEKGVKDIADNHARMLRKLKRNGIKVRMLVPDSGDEMKKLADLAEIRLIKESYGRFAIVDNEHMLISLTDDEEVHETQDIAFWAKSPHAAENVTGSLFESLWKNAKPSR